jgi:hypothetical protein
MGLPRSLISSLTSEPKRKRKAPEDRRLELAVRDDKVLTDWLSDDKISTFDDLCSKAGDFVKGSTDVEWLVIRRREFLCISAVEVNDVPRFTVVIRVSEDMTVDVFKGDCAISTDSLHWVLGADCKLACWSQLSTLLSHFTSCAKGSTLSLQDQVNLVDRALNELISMTEMSDEYEPNVSC